MADNSALRAETTACILKSRVELDALRCEVHEAMARGRDTIFRSQELIARINNVLARS